MARYKDPRGGLTVDKENTQRRNEKKESATMKQGKSNVYISAEKMMDTLYSYQQGQFTNNPTENGGSECVFCGEKTSYDNRHVCAECWKKYGKDIVDGIKNSVQDVDIHIE